MLDNISLKVYIQNKVTHKGNRKEELLMYKNLIRILNEKRITMKSYAEFLGVSEKTVQNKIYGRTDFTLSEAIKTCSLICPEYKLDFVFEKDEMDAPIAEAV